MKPVRTFHVTDGCVGLGLFGMYVLCMHDAWIHGCGRWMEEWGDACMYEITYLHIYIIYLYIYIYIHIYTYIYIYIHIYIHIYIYA